MYLPLSQSLKDRRRVIKSLKDRLRGRHNISIAEVDAQDVWQTAVLGIASVSDSRTHLERLFEAILAEIEARIPGEITRREIEFL